MWRKEGRRNIPYSETIYTKLPQHPDILAMSLCIPWSVARPASEMRDAERMKSRALLLTAHQAPSPFSSSSFLNCALNLESMGLRFWTILLTIPTNYIFKAPSVNRIPCCTFEISLSQGISFSTILPYASEGPASVMTEMHQVPRVSPQCLFSLIT